MTDRQIYRIAGVCSLAAIACTFLEYPFYLARSGFLTVTDPAAIVDFTNRNATNIMCCVFLDFLILPLIVVFAAGFRHMILRADAQQEWLATLFSAFVNMYIVITLIADCLQAASVVDALTPPADPLVMRAFIESMYLMYGAVALWIMGILMGIAGAATLAAKALPRWAAWVAFGCALAAGAFTPSMFVHHADPYGFYNPAGWGVNALAAGLPVAVWMIVTGTLMLRKEANCGP